MLPLEMHLITSKILPRIAGEEWLVTVDEKEHYIPEVGEVSIHSNSNILSFN